MQLSAALMFFVSSLVVGCLCSAVPKTDAQKSRVHDEELSEKKHYDGEEHDPEYDHDAFVGRDDAKSYEDLTPEESKEKLSIIYDKVDKDKDELVTHTELEAWIRHVQQQYMVNDAKKQWEESDVVGTDMRWDHYKEKNLDNEPDDDDERQTIAREKRRWDKADLNGDGMLNQEEFVAFLHPEDTPHMRDVVIEETMEEIDKDNDGFISLKEYMADMAGGDDEDEDGDDDKEWVQSERDSFHNERDKNRDGQLDRQEVAQWIIPEDYDHAGEEASHLMSEADENKDGQLSRQEVLDKYDLFVGSQATDFGDVLTRHDEF